MSSSSRFNVGKISVHPALKEFVDTKVLPGTGVTKETFWLGLDSIVSDLMPVNSSLLHKRKAFQKKIDDWHRSNPAPYCMKSYTAFLVEIGYLEPECPQFKIQTESVDDEIARVAGPQLVCPIDNARFILNAANARWGSLLDALYGTDAVPYIPGSADGPYDTERGAAVFRATHQFLDEFFPLRLGSWDEVGSLRLVDGELLVGLQPVGNSAWGSEAMTEVKLLDPTSFVGYADDSGIFSVLLRKNGLHLELVVDSSGGKLGHKAGIVDVKLESALSTICDFEDSACTVDAQDKVAAYANWLGLMNRSLSVTVAKKGERLERTLNPNRRFVSPDGNTTIELPGQALLLARNVGMHIPSNLVTTTHGSTASKGFEDVPEHFIDAMVTAAAALHDVRVHGANSRHGSIYIVKPKMHGPEEARLANALMERVEQVLSLPKNTIKIGVMDEERRTSANLAQTMHAVKDRLFFVNTGFLDRTADEIHTSMQAGIMLPKDKIKAAEWYQAYEQGNVATALQAALVGRGQIGKGMWAEPDNMSSMLAQKGQQLDVGASTAWVPSPVAATLHALHYLRQNVPEVQQKLMQELRAGNDQESRRKALLTPPLLMGASLSPSEVQAELDNNVQGLLGYVVRWVGQGIGCSKVPNLQEVQLMEDRATLRISSQHIANWLHHGVVNEKQVMDSLRHIAGLVDAQNSHDEKYIPMAPSFDSPEWYAAIDLIFHGRETLNGYTEAALSHWRRVRKSNSGNAHPSKETRSAALAGNGEPLYRGQSSMGGAI